MTPLQVTTQAQEMDKTQKDHGSDSSVAPGEPAGLQCPRGNMDRSRPTRAGPGPPSRQNILGT